MIKDKYEAFNKMGAPTTKKEVTKLNGMLKALNKFISKSDQHAFFFYNFLRKEGIFEKSLIHSTKVVSVVLLRDVNSAQSSVYFIYKALVGPETRY